METGYPEPYIDLAQILLYVFWGFFFYLIYWLNKEGKREGFPLEDDVGSGSTNGFVGLPKAKTFLLPDGRTFDAPRLTEEPPLNATRQYPYAGSAYVPHGDGMGQGVGPGAWANRADVPDQMFDGTPRLQPLRILTDFHVVDRDPNPIGKSVVGADGESGGMITDVWADRAEHLLRYYEFEKTDGGKALLPVNFTQIKKKDGPVIVNSIMGRHFADVPATKSPDEVTLLEEDQISGFYGGGYLYADPKRQEPVV